MWIALFIFCNPIEGCMAITFDDQKPYYETKEICEQYTEDKSDFVVAKLKEKNVPGVLYYKCEKSTGEDKWL
jgi:hypothetical protein